MEALPKSLLRDAKRFGYEETEHGLFIPHANMMIGGVFDYELYRGGEMILAERGSKNLVVNEGLNHILDVVLHGSTQTATWYVGVFEADYTPVAADVMSTFPANSTESTAYDEATRPAYVEAAASSQVTTNVASKAAFTFNATKTIYGAFLSSTATKGAGTGVLLAADKAGTAKAVVDDDQLLVTYSITIAAA